MLVGVCRRRRLSSSVTLHGGPVEFRPVKATLCLRCRQRRFPAPVTSHWTGLDHSLKTLNIDDVSSLCMLPVIVVVTIKLKIVIIIAKTKHFVNKCHKTDKKQTYVTHCLLSLTQFVTWPNLRSQNNDNFLLTEPTVAL